jgi:hypothetical protein
MSQSSVEVALDSDRGWVRPERQTDSMTAWMDREHWDVTLS